MKRTKPFIVLLMLCTTCSSSLFSQDLFPVRRVTTNPAQESFPSWTSKGELIVYARMDLEDSSLTGLWGVPPSGEGPFQITGCISEHPDCSPDGHYIVFDADTGNNIKIVASSGGCPIRFLPDTIQIRMGGTPCWSPDGSSIAFRSGYRLLLADVQSGQVRCIFHKTGILPIPSCWSPDGNSVFTTLRNEITYESTIARIFVHSGDVRELTHNKENLYRYCDISPDGELLVYTSKESGNYHLWVMPATGGKAVQLTSNSPADDGPTWSPQGNSIAFVSARSGNADIWAIDVDMELLRQKIEAANAH